MGVYFDSRDRFQFVSERGRMPGCVGTDLVKIDDTLAQLIQSANPEPAALVVLLNSD